MGENKLDGIQMGTPTNKRPFTEVSPVSPSVGITLNQLSNMLDDKFQSKLDRIEEKLGRLEKIHNNCPITKNKPLRTIPGSHYTETGQM